MLVVISSLVKSKPPGEERLDAAIVEESDVKPPDVAIIEESRVEPLDVAIVKKLGDELLDVPITIIASSYEFYTALRMCGPKVGIAANQREIEIIYADRSGHGMMANMSGTVTISPPTGEAMDLCWATNPSLTPNKTAVQRTRAEHFAQTTS